MNTIFLVTAISLDVDNNNFNKRSFGFFGTEERAKKAVADNECDMYECYYNYVVIEQVKEGIHPEIKEIQWYKWNHEKECFVEWFKPKYYQNVFNFGIG